jgi:CRP-like cAMP-binding protein
LIDDGAAVPDAQLDAIASVPFLAMLPLATRERLAASMVPVSLPAGRELFARGDPGDRFYVLAEGAVEIELPAGPKLEQAPAYLGEIALLHDVPRTATVRATADASLWSLERDEFLGAVLGHARSRTSADAVAVARLGAA